MVKMFYEEADRLSNNWVAKEPYKAEMKFSFEAWPPFCPLLL